MRRRALPAVFALLMAATAVWAAPKRALQPITIHAQPIEQFQRFGMETRFGEFEFRGGLVLSSPAQRFGGLSGIEFRPGGSDFVAISDLGSWFTGRVIRNAGRLAGIDDARFGPILDAKGKPLSGRRVTDAESIALSPDGRGAYVSFERGNNLKFYRFAADPGPARAEAVVLPSSARGMVHNRGLETVAVAPEHGPLAGSPVLVAERSLDEAGNHRAWVVRGPRAGAFSILRSGDYDVTDGAFMPNGDFLILERRVNQLMIGVDMRLRRIAGDAIRPGALLDGPVVLEASMADQIDNMEGLAVSTDPDGRVRITLVSDDNLNLVQRTLLLEFVWLGPASEG